MCDAKRIAEQNPHTHYYYLPISTDEKEQPTQHETTSLIDWSSTLLVISVETLFSFIF